MLIFILTILVLLVGLLIVGTHVTNKLISEVSHLDDSGVTTFVDKLLVYGRHNDTLLIEDEAEKNFLQFKKYIAKDKEFGVDCVFPVAEKNSDEVDICTKFSAKYRIVDTDFGWAFLFIQVSNGAKLNEHLLARLYSIAGLDFSKNVHISDVSTMKLSVKKPIYGEQDLGFDDPDRFEIWKPLRQ